MKVLIIHCAYKQRGGEDTVVTEEMNLLKSKGITVDLLQFNNEGKTILKLLQLPFNIHSYLETRKRLASFKPDVVHIHNLHYAGSVSVIYAIKKSGLPSVITLHNFRLLCPSGTLFKNGELYLDSLKKKFPWKAVMQGAYRNSVLITFWVSMSVQLHTWINTWKTVTRYIVLSRHAKDIFLHSRLALRKEQLTVKPNFCAMPGVTGQHAGGFFLFVGRLSEEKGIILLLNAFAATGYNIKIAGDGPLIDQVKTYSTKYPNIEFLHFQNKDAIISLMNNCTALVFPSIWYEGMPLTIIEAFACSTPVIASRLGVMEDMISHQYNGLHFEPGNKNDFTAKLKLWHELGGEEKALYRKNAHNTYLEHYTPEKNFEQLMSIYLAAIAEKNKPVKAVYRSARQSGQIVS